MECGIAVEVCTANTRGGVEVCLRIVSCTTGGFPGQEKKHSMCGEYAANGSLEELQKRQPEYIA